MQVFAWMYNSSSYGLAQLEKYQENCILYRTSSEQPWIAASGSKNVYAVWQENATGNYTIFLSKSTDSGATFSKPTKLTNSIKGVSEAESKSGFIVERKPPLTRIFH
jgi:hypothetical protein